MITFFRDRLVEGPLPIAADAPWLLHAAGVFETVLWNGRGAAHLDRHLARAAHGLEALGLGAFPHQDVGARVREVVGANGLAEAFARVRILLALVEEGGAPALVVTASRLDRPRLDPVRLVTEPRVHASHLAGHKTLAYLHCRLARTRARALGADDAVLVDPSGAVLETSSAALLFRIRGVLVSPAGPGLLPSVSLDVVAGYHPVVRRRIGPEDLEAVEAAWVLGSLQGARPVAALDDRRWPPEPGLAAGLRALIWDLAPDAGWDRSAG